MRTDNITQRIFFNKKNKHRQRGMENKFRTANICPGSLTMVIVECYGKGMFSHLVLSLIKRRLSNLVI